VILIASYSGLSWVSRLIKYRQGYSQTSHVAFYNDQTGKVLEAWQGDGVVLRDTASQGHTPGTPITLLRVAGASDVLLQSVWDDAAREIGKPYDLRGVLQFRRTEPTHDADKNRWFCSELVSAKLATHGVRLFRRLEPFQATPAHVHVSALLTVADTLTT